MNGERSATLSLTPEELTMLERILRPSEVSAPADKGLLPPGTPTKALCLKVGCAWTQALEANNGVAIELTLTEAEVWILRERVDSKMMEGRVPTGTLSLVKLYHALHALDAAGATEGLPTAEHEEQSAREVRDALDARAMRGGADHGPHTDDADDAAHPTA